jgi:hypothetical protein
MLIAILVLYLYWWLYLTARRLYDVLTYDILTVSPVWYSTHRGRPRQSTASVSLWIRWTVQMSRGQGGGKRLRRLEVMRFSLSGGDGPII